MCWHSESDMDRERRKSGQQCSKVRGTLHYFETMLRRLRGLKQCLARCAPNADRKPGCPS
jgi:hypothetical protein